MPPKRAAQPRRKRAADEGSGASRKYTTIRVEDLSDFNEFKKILIVGDSGVGKTVLVGGAPKGLFVSTEKGTISAKRFGSEAKLIRVETWPQLEESVEYIGEYASKIGYVLLDSLPKMQRLLRRHLLQVNVEEGRKGADLDSLQIQDYDKWYNMFLRFYDRLNELPVNVIYTSTPMRVETEDDEGDPIDIVLPAIQGKAKEGYALAQYICAEVDSLWYLNIERKKGKQQRVLITQKRPPYFAKDRYAALPARVVLPENDPTLMARLLAKLDSGELAPAEPAPEPDDLEDEDTEEEPEDDEEEPEEEPAPRRKPSARKAASKRPTAKKAQKKPEASEEDDIDLEADDEDDDDYE